MLHDHQPYSRSAQPISAAELARIFSDPACPRCLNSGTLCDRCHREFVASRVEVPALAGWYGGPVGLVLCGVSAAAIAVAAVLQL